MVQGDQLKPVDPSLLRTYIALARNVEPYIPPNLQEYICSHYVSMRKREKDAEEQQYITPRTLMSILRLSQV